MFLAIVTVLAVTAARADTVFLIGGEIVIGKIVVDEKTKVVIKSEVLGRIEIPRERILRIQLDPGPVAPPTNTPPSQPFVPSIAVAPSPPPAVPTNTIPVAVDTNAPSKHRWFWQRKPQVHVPGTDWIQLKSGEWLRGRLYGMQRRKLEFESDELDDLEFDWKDIHQVVTPRALVSYGERRVAWGSLRVDRANVTVTGGAPVTFPRFDLVGIAPGLPREIDYWSGRINVGLNLRSGNTEQSDLVTKIKLERRTPNTHLKLEYVGNNSEVAGEESVNNQRINEFFDILLTRRLFLRVPQSEFYHDPFQNIAQRFTAGGGVGYYLIDKPKVEWIVAGGPAYQFIRFETVEADERREHSTPAFVLQSNFDVDLTKRVDLEVGYQSIAANKVSGGLNHHGTVTLEIDLTHRLDLDISFIWDRIGNPQADSAGDIPEKNDYRLNLSIGVKF